MENGGGPVSLSSPPCEAFSTPLRIPQGRRRDEEPEAQRDPSGHHLELMCRKATTSCTNIHKRRLRGMHRVRGGWTVGQTDGRADGQSDTWTDGQQTVCRWNSCTARRSDVRDVWTDVGRSIGSAGCGRSDKRTDARTLDGVGRSDSGRATL